MTKRTKKSKFGELMTLICAYVALWYIYSATLSTFLLIFIGLTTLLFWFCFLMPTYCDYRTLQNTPCTRSVRGKLGGCHSHGRLKRDALFATFHLRNPGMIFRVMWSAPGQPTPTPTKVVGSTSPGATTARPSKQSAYDLLMLYLTVISTAATVIALFI